MVNSPLIRPYLLGGSFGGGTLDSHDVRLLDCKSWFLQKDHLGNNLVVVHPIKNWSEITAELRWG